MGTVLDDEAQRANKLDDRQKTLKEAEIAVKRGKEEVYSEREQNRLKTEHNTSVERQLILRQEQMDQDVMRRVNNILLHERKHNESEIEKLNLEIQHVNTLTGTVSQKYNKLKAEFDSMLKELKQQEVLVVQISQEKAELALELHEKMERARETHEHTQHESQSKIEDLTCRVADLKYSLETSQIKLSELQKHHGT